MIGQCILRNLQVMTLLSIEKLGLKMSGISSDDSGVQLNGMRRKLVRRERNNRKSLV